MKLIRTRSEPAASADHPAGPRHQWKLLVVDDEPDMREVTRLNLNGFRFADRDRHMLEASSAYEARELLAAHKDLSLIHI